MAQARQLVDPRVEEPRLGRRIIGDDLDFVYVMRTDSSYVSGQFAARLGVLDLFEEVREVYEDYLTKLASLLADAYQTEYDSIAIDLLDGNAIDARRRELIAEGNLVVSLDPLMEDGCLPLAFSRCYALGGSVLRGMVARPGYPPIGDQVAAIDDCGDVPITVIEDDIYTGETIASTLRRYLGQAYDRITELVAGTRIAGEMLDHEHYAVSAAIVYSLPDGSPAIEKLDLGDPRDYLIGASGLVSILPNGDLGRLPYILPFVSPSARATIPGEAEAEFSFAALNLGASFYAKLSDVACMHIVLEHTDPVFRRGMEVLLRCSPDDPMLDVVERIRREFTALCMRFQG